MYFLRKFSRKVFEISFRFLFLNFKIKRVGARAQVKAEFVSKKNVTLFYNVYSLRSVAFVNTDANKYTENFERKSVLRTKKI